MRTFGLFESIIGYRVSEADLLLRVRGAARNAAPPTACNYCTACIASGAP